MSKRFLLNKTAYSTEDLQRLWEAAEGSGGLVVSYYSPSASAQKKREDRVTQIKRGWAREYDLDPRLYVKLARNSDDLNRHQLRLVRPDKIYPSGLERLGSLASEEAPAGMVRQILVRFYRIRTNYTGVDNFPTSRSELRCAETWWESAPLSLRFSPKGPGKAEMRRRKALFDARLRILATENAIAERERSAAKYQRKADEYLKWRDTALKNVADLLFRLQASLQDLEANTEANTEGEQ